MPGWRITRTTASTTRQEKPQAGSVQSGAAGCWAVRTAQPMLLEATAPGCGPQNLMGAPGLGRGLAPASLQREGGRQQGGAGHPGVLQGQSEAGGVSRRVSVRGNVGCGGLLRVRRCWPFMLPPPAGTSLWSCLLFLCTPSRTTTSPSPGPRQVSAAPTPSPPRDGVRPGQGRQAGASSTHPPPPLLASAAPDTDAPVDTNLIEFDTK